MSLPYIISYFSYYSFPGFAIMLIIMFGLMNRRDEVLTKRANLAITGGIHFILLVSLISLGAFFSIWLELKSGDHPPSFTGIYATFFDPYFSFSPYGGMSIELLMILGIHLLPAFLAQLFWLPRLKRSSFFTLFYAFFILIFLAGQMFIPKQPMSEGWTIYPPLSALPQIVLDFKPNLAVALISVILGQAFSAISINYFLPKSVKHGRLP